MGHLIGGELRQSHLGDELIYEDDDANGADEAPQERPAEDVVEKAKSKDARCQDEGTGQASDDAGDFGVLPSVFIARVVFVDVFPNNLAGQKRARCFWADDHLGACAKNSIDQRVDGKAVQAVDRGDVSEVGGVGKSHGDVEGSHGQGGNEVALEVAPLILLCPVDDGHIVCNVHEPLVLDAGPLGEILGCALVSTAASQHAVGEGIAQKRVGGIGVLSRARIDCACKAAAEAAIGIEAPIAPARCGPGGHGAVIAVVLPAARCSVPVSVGQQA